ncbi:MAG: hypothetical protein K8F54_12360 [Altibacter sp.]|uniref:sulfatase-like hydrolase/transferase n=1 Tax=Altibacter sp. TaxID=2024823 RepID=UPI001E088AC6|nr:sulfatase-like hydrolase/transferase [Altibacter sp.]MBZ0328394.1 hypothetical protein [Altibacter sp.]
MAKIVLLQLFLAIITMPLLVETILIRSSYSNSWTTQNDTIEEVLFQKKPNVYFIEPDGYSNFSELKKPTYDIDISSFENFLQKRGFSNYPEFRSNYTSTLASNASFFSMKHHYFNNDLKSDEVQNARDIIMYDNPVLRIFKNNGYKNYFVSDSPYLLANRPKTLFDETNFKFWDLSYIDNGIRKNRKDVVSSFKEVFNKQDSEPRFFFIQFIKPWHISGKEGGSKGVDRERELWTERLFEANKILRQIIDEILAKDPQGLIVIMADHGGYVGYNYSDESRTKTSDPNLITTIFSSNLSIHWPDGIAPSFENELDSSVNIFRILFSYLSNNEAYLLHMEDDSSYILLRKGTEEGIYSYIDDSGNLVFKKLQL